MPTPASRASSVVQAPPWLARLLTPLIARHVAGEMARKYPGLSPAEIGEKMRAELPSGADPAEGERLIRAVVARLPGRTEAEPSNPLSAWVLLAANLLPLYGVLVWNWEVFPLLALFWMENLIIGVLNAARMLLVDPADLAGWALKLFFVPFFCVHYGMFTFIHGIFVFAMFGSRGMDDDVLARAAETVRQWDLWLALGALVASHLFSFGWNYIYRGEYRRASVSALMMRPYARVMILHLAILLGGFAAMLLGSPLWMLVILVGIKVTLDLRAHLKEHRAVQSPDAR